MLDTGFRYSGRTFSFADIEAIKVLRQDASLTSNLKHNPLINSAIYNIQLKTETIQIVGKLYKNVDSFVEGLAVKAKLSIQSIKE